MNGALNLLLTCVVKVFYTKIFYTRKQIVMYLGNPLSYRNKTLVFYSTQVEYLGT